MKRINLVLGMLVMFVAASASAVSYTCDDKSGKLRAAVNTSSNGETAALILSDPSIGAGNKTIARFPEAVVNDDEKDYLSVTGKVDFRNPEMKRGEYIGGTRLGTIKTITLSVEEDNGKYEGELKLEKRRGPAVHIDMKCTQK